YLTELDPKQNWSKDVADLLRKAIHERNEHPTDVIEKKTWLEKLDTLLQVNLLHLKDHFERMRKGLFKCRDYIFNFLENPRIPSDNNASERGIRKLKIKQKISG
ncbi:IS66 family transposase, partial [Prevotella sp. SGI.027]